MYYWKCLSFSFVFGSVAVFAIICGQSTVDDDDYVVRMEEKISQLERKVAKLESQQRTEQSGQNDSK